MTSALPSARLTLRALLLSSLLVFGQGLVLALTSSFQPLAASNSNHKAVQSLSSLTFLTLLWLGSTALEQADVIFLSRRASRRDSGLIAKWSSTSSASRALLETDRRCNTTGQQTEEKADGLCSTFCREDVELVLGLLLMTAWIVYWKEAVCVLSTHGPHFVWNLVFLKIPYVLIHVTLLALAGQVVVSLLLSAIRSRSLAREDRGASEEGAGVWVGYGTTGHEAEKENGRQLRCEGCKAVLDATP